MNTAAARDFASPTKSCDLIMKGGITSGIVYPKAILELATQYKFRGVAGSSAGAIAAAGTAAAEMGRKSGGFLILDQVCVDLSKPGSLLNLFEPAKETKPAFDLMLELLKVKGNPERTTFQILIRRALRLAIPILLVSWIVLAAVAVGLIGWLVGFGAPGNTWHLATAVCFTLIVSSMMTIWCVSRQIRRRARELLAAIESNHLGMCTGVSPTGSVALVDYLNQKYDEMAGLSAGQGPLTFGHLAQHDIKLVLMTSNLSLRRPYTFPNEREIYLFSEEEFKRYFPASVIHRLKNPVHGDGTPSDPLTKGLPAPPAGFFYLPPGDELPVIVAVRTSLSLPLLFSAVPLYQIQFDFWQRFAGDDSTKMTIGDLQQHYFSDGGIVSNFPIHIFDRWLPDCPTFGINLADLPERAFREPAKSVRNSAVEAKNDEPPATTPSDQISSDYLNQCVNPKAEAGVHQHLQGQIARGNAKMSLQKDPFVPVYLPDADDPPLREWLPIHAEERKNGLISIINFAKAIFYTAKNHRDNLQADLPSYRERIVTVRLKSEEGGMNLNMPPKTIEGLMSLGTEAGKKLLDFNFEHHHWVRFRIIMAHLERELKLMIEAIGDDKQRALIESAQKPDYPWRFQNSYDGVAALKYLEQLAEALRQHWSTYRIDFDCDRIEPEPQKRLVPKD